MNQDQRTSDYRYEYLMARYETAISDIERTKDWQWKVFFHTVIAQGALLAILEKSRVGIFAAAASLLLGFIGVYFVWMADRSLARFRDYVQAVFGELELLDPRLKAVVGRLRNPKPSNSDDGRPSGGNAAPRKYHRYAYCGIILAAAVIVVVRSFSA